MPISFPQMSLCNIFALQAILYQSKRDVAAWKRLGCPQRIQWTWWQIVAMPYTGFMLFACILWFQANRPVLLLCCHLNQASHHPRRTWPAQKLTETSFQNLLPLDKERPLLMELVWHHREILWWRKVIQVGQTSVYHGLVSVLLGIHLGLCLIQIKKYSQTSNISRTLGYKFVDHSGVVGASPVGAAPTTSSFST